MAEKKDDKYIIEILTTPINSKYSDYSPFIAPDESYLIFASDYRQGGYGETDLYICYKNIDGSWTEPINVGADINSTEQEFCPMVTLDEKYFFFISSRNGNYQAYWVDAKIIEKLKPKEFK